MATYTLEDVKNLKKAEIVDLLIKENIDFDKSQSVFTLRSLLLKKDKDEQPKEDVNEQPVEQPAEQPKEEVKVEQPKPANKSITKIQTLAFKSELAKRRGAFGKVTRSAFDVELARRQGKGDTRQTFADELRMRQMKFKR